MNEIQNTIIALKSQKAELVSEKNRLMDEMAVVKGQLSERLPMAEYMGLEKIRRRLVRDLIAVDSAICTINPKISAACYAEHEEIKKSTAESEDTSKAHKDVMGEFIGMRDEYQTFAADSTRSPTMRRMASEFVSKMTPIIRRALNQRA